MEFEVTVTFDDYWRATLLHTRLSARWAYLFAALFLALVFIAIALHQSDSRLTIILLMAPLVIIIPRAMIRHVFLPEMALRAYSEQKTIHAPHRYRVSDEGLTGAAQYGEARLPWDHFVKWKDDSRLILVYHTRSQFIIIPKRALAGDAEVGKLLDTLRRNGVPAA